MPNRNTSKETIDGGRLIHVEGNFAYMEQLAPTYTEINNDSEAVLTALDLDSSLTTTDPVIANQPREWRQDPWPVNKTMRLTKTMEHLTEQTVSCPYCGEGIDVLIDPQDAGDQYIEDCQVCCRPITFNVMMDSMGNLSVSVYDENEAC